MKRILAFLLLIVLASPLMAAWLNHVSVTIKQPDGTSLQLFATGDEFYSWVHDANGYTILRNEEGFLVYALLEGEELVASSFKVGQVEPQSLGIAPWLNIPSSQMLSIRNAALEHTKKMELASGVQRATLDAEGEINNLVVYIRFSDQNEFIIDTTLYLDMFNKDEPDYNSMHNYFEMVSYGTLSLTSTAYPIPPTETVISYQDEHPRNYYEPYDANNNPDGYIGDQRAAREFLLLKNAVEYIADEVPTGLDLDYNNDGNVDNVVFIVKGGPGAWADLLWPHRWSLYGEDAFINGKRVWDFNFQLEASLNESGVGVLCHEMYHSLGAPDLYHYNQDSYTPVGRWDIMEQNMNPPQSMGAYMKHMYGGWIDEIPEITESGYYTLNPLTDPENHVFKIASPNHDWQYFVLEYRQQLGTFESQIPGSGLLVYRINGALEGDGNASGPPDEVYVYRPGGTVDVNGAVNNANFSVEEGRTEITNETDPRLFLTNNDFGGIEITEVSSAGETISFYVNIPGEPMAAFEADATLICPDQVVSFKDLSAGLPETYQWSFSPNEVTYMNGTDANSTEPQVIFNSEQTYSVSLSVDNEYGESTVSMDDYIQFTTAEMPFFANFEDGSLKSRSFYVVNPDDNVTWQTMPVQGNNSSMAAAMRIRNYFEVGDRDALITPPLDFSAYSNMDIQFEYAYAKYLANYTDSLIVYASVDCGASWDRIFAGGDDGEGSFATAPLTEEEFIPASGNDWCGQGYGAACITLSLNEYLGYDRVRVKFESYSQLGNNLYVDNIMIAPNVGIEESLMNEISIWPNPAKDFIQIEGLEAYKSIEVIDIYGRIIHHQELLNTSELKIPINGLDAGMYMIRFDDKVSKKLLIN